MSRKERIHKLCIEMLESRLDSYQQEFNELISSQSSETKSSMGDKYETAREMINQEKNKLGSQIEEQSKQLAFLKQLNPSIKSDAVLAGALVKTERGEFYIAVGLGLVESDGLKTFIISPVSPLAQAMLDKKSEDTFTLNGITQGILDIC